MYDKSAVDRRFDDRPVRGTTAQPLNVSKAHVLLRWVFVTRRLAKDSLTTTPGVSAAGTFLFTRRLAWAKEQRNVQAKSPLKALLMLTTTSAETRCGVVSSVPSSPEAALEADAKLKNSRRLILKFERGASSLRNVYELRDP